MQQSNTYIILFTAAVTIVVGGLLSFASQGLAPAQKKSIELDTKNQILSSVMNKNNLKQLDGNQILKLYQKRIKSLVVDINGKKITTDSKGAPMVAEKVSVLKNYKKTPENRIYPVFKYMDEADSTKVIAYILPLYGAGLWDKIWGYIAVKEDLNTILGVSFDHKQETPGLGARISTSEIQERYKGKKLLNEKDEFVSVMMVKGEGNSNLTDHQVDGMSGATITGRGVNDMLKNYLNYYKNYFKLVKNNDNS